MKKKDKVITIVGLSVLLCSLFLVTIPATTIAAGQDDYALGVYGNANEDDTIDMRDLTYVKLIFFGKKPETELADAKYDGKINPLDFIQIKLIIVGKEKELTIVDSADRIVTVKKPVKRIVALTFTSTESSKTLKAQDKVVGVGKNVKTMEKVFFPELSKLPSAGGYSVRSLDPEKIIVLNPDIVITYAAHSTGVGEKLKPAGIMVLGLTFYEPMIIIEEMEKLGYILDKRDEAEEFIDFYEGCMDGIVSKVEEIPEDERPRVYFEKWRPYSAVGLGSADHKRVEMAGGYNIFRDSPSATVDPEAVITRDPEIIVRSALTKVAGFNTDDITKLSDIRDEIMDRPELGKVTAVKNGKVYVTSTVIYSRAGHFIGLGYLAKWFHPELFEDLDPNAIHQEYLTRFQGLDFDLDKHGVFVYHPEEHPDGK